jgi:anti-sigma regulatory factor (Ser/Thr protein kinase)
MRRQAGGGFRIIVLNEELDREGAIEVISSRHVEHLINAKPNPAESLFATLTKMLRPDFFGVHRYLLAGADVKSWSVGQPSEKSFVLAGVRAVAEDVDCHPRIIDLLISAVDEMLINALYKPAQRGATADQPVTVECGADGRLLCVGVLDDHGVLEVEQIYAGLRAAARAREAGISDSSVSAHLGFRIMLGALSQLAINVEPGRRTEIIGIVDLRKSLRDHRASAPSLGIFKK